MSKKSWLGTSIFVILTFWAFYYGLPSQIAIELVSLATFGFIGALDITLEQAAARLARGSRPLAARRGHFSLWVPLLWIFGGFALAAGGGVARRFFELMLTFFLTLDQCYVKTLALFWPWQDPGYIFTGAGIFVGATVSLFLLINPVHALSARKDISEWTAYVDGFASAFFAAYGVEAAVKLTNVLPLPTPLGPMTSYIVVCGILAAAFGTLTSTCGGFFKNLISDSVIHWRFQPIVTMMAWVRTAAFWDYLTISLIGFATFIVVSQPVPVFGTCMSINQSHMYVVILACAGLGFALAVITPFGANHR